MQRRHLLLRPQAPHLPLRQTCPIPHTLHSLTHSLTHSSQHPTHPLASGIKAGSLFAITSSQRDTPDTPVKVTLDISGSPIEIQ